MDQNYQGIAQIQLENVRKQEDIQHDADEQTQNLDSNNEKEKVELIIGDNKIRLNIKEVIQQQNSEKQQNDQKSNSESDFIEEEYLPPPNPILNVDTEDNSIQTAEKFVFNKLPEFNNQVNINNGKYFVQTIPSNIKKMYKKGYSLKQDKVFREGELSEIYGSQDHVYRKMDNANFNFVPLDKKRYFSGLFCEFKKLVHDEKGDALTTQDDLISYIQKSQKNIPQLPQQLMNDKLQSNNKTHTNNNSEIAQKAKYKSTLKFDSSFESGNLFAAYQLPYQLLENYI